MGQSRLTLHVEWFSYTGKWQIRSGIRETELTIIFFPAMIGHTKCWRPKPAHKLVTAQLGVSYADVISLLENRFPEQLVYKRAECA